MKGSTIFQSDYAKISIQFWNKYPVTDTLIVCLYFFAVRMLNCCGTPFKPDVRTLDQHVIPEIFRHARQGCQRIKH